jgi:pSer/pThr/pTyr-binding forkhead associated (FHA) protein
MLLVCTLPDGTTSKIRLRHLSNAPTVTIGRDSEATICLNDPQCSRIHCGIRYWDDIFVIRDMKSQNGMIVNEKQVEVAMLTPGDTVRIGGTKIQLESDNVSADATIRLK